MIFFFFLPVFSLGHNSSGARKTVMKFAMPLLVLEMVS